MKSSTLKTRFISHGTLGSKDLEATRRFYEEFLGLEVVRTSPVSLMIRLGGNHVYAVVHTRNKERMPRCYHNGLDVDTDADVDEAWRLCTEQTTPGRSSPIRRAAIPGFSSRATSSAADISKKASGTSGRMHRLKSAVRT